MTADITVSQQEIDLLYDRLKKEADAGGYRLNPDVTFAKELLQGILTNNKRYGYWSCPCRLASGQQVEDQDIICPCDYRDIDLKQYGACYCGLYVSEEIYKGTKKLKSIPERRPPPDKRKVNQTIPTLNNAAAFPLPIWRCKVCGYLCAREAPPDICPICKARDRFERFG